MTETKHFCDMCSEQIHSDRTLLLVKTGPERLRRPEIDLCSDCLPKVTGLIDARPNAVAPTPRASKTNRLAAG